MSEFADKDSFLGTNRETRARAVIPIAALRGAVFLSNVRSL